MFHYGDEKPFMQHKFCNDRDKHFFDILLLCMNKKVKFFSHVPDTMLNRLDPYSMAPAKSSNSK